MKTANNNNNKFTEMNKNLKMNYEKNELTETSLNEN